MLTESNQDRSEELFPKGFVQVVAVVRGGNLKKEFDVNEEQSNPAMTIPVVYPADILPIPDAFDVADDTEGQDTDSFEEYALYLSLPQDSAKLFKESKLLLAMELSVFQMKADFRVAILVLQAESLQVRVIIPLCDEKSRLWIDQCVKQSCVTFFLAAQDSDSYRRFDSLLLLPDAERVLHSVFQASTASAFDVLLTISSSLPSIAELASVSSCVVGTDVAQVNVCVVRDFFNTDECLMALGEFKRPR